MGKDSLENSVRVYRKSEVIFKENSLGNQMYILRSGKVKLVLGGARGEAEVGTLEEPGDFFGEMALIDGSPRSATATAAEDNTELEVLDREGFLYMIREYPKEFGLEVMRKLCERIRVGNVLYLEIIRGAMEPFCRQNCLGKTLDAFARQAMSLPAQVPAEKAMGMSKWRCLTCDYVYIPDIGDPKGKIPAGTPFEELPPDWTCPDCGATKGIFQKID